MSYCRFRNTLDDLRDCYDHLNDKGLSEEEATARKSLAELCRDVALAWLPRMIEEEDQEPPSGDVKKRTTVSDLPIPGREE
jgi:hypothetical protein